MGAAPGDPTRPANPYLRSAAMATRAIDARGVGAALSPCHAGRGANRLNMTDMIDPEQEAWWRTTRALAVAALGGALLLGFLLYVAARASGEETFLALPPYYLLAAAVMPLVLLALVFWHARRQAEVDRQHDMGGD